jgi:hypothetical protein
LDPLTREQVEQLSDIANAMLGRLDPDGHMTALYGQIEAPGNV